jgi:hypothetical protein
MNIERLMEYRLAGETEVLEEHPPQYHTLHHKSHMTWSWIEPRLQSFEGDN